MGVCDDVHFLPQKRINKSMTIEEIKRKANSILEEHGVTYAAVFGSLLVEKTIREATLIFWFVLAVPSA